MKRALIFAKDYTFNIAATEIKAIDESATSFVVLNGEEVVGVFNIDDIKSAYLIPKGEKNLEM